MTPVEQGRELARLRKEADLLLRHVGAAFDIDKAAVAQWEAGKSSPDRRKLTKLDELYGGRGEVLALFGFGPTSLLDPVEQLRERVATLDLQVQEQAGLIEDLAAAVKRLQKPPRRSAGDSR